MINRGAGTKTCGRSEGRRVELRRRVTVSLNPLSLFATQPYSYPSVVSMRNNFVASATATTLFNLVVPNHSLAGWVESLTSGSLNRFC